MPRPLTVSLYLRTRCTPVSICVDMWTTVRAAVKTEGIFSLWRGLGATLMRDVPFSAIYWTGYEALKRRYQAQNAGNLGASDVAVPTEVAFAAGATAGSVSRASLWPLQRCASRLGCQAAPPRFCTFGHSVLNGLFFFFSFFSFSPSDL